LKIFVSRAISDDSPFQKLIDIGHEVYGQSLLDFLPLKFENFPDSNWIFFYSKNGIQYFFDAISDAQKQAISNRKIAVMGKESARFLASNFGMHVSFIASNSLEKSADDFANILNDDHVLFIKAKHSKATFEKQLQPHQYQSIIVYENVITTNKIELPYFDILVFTSPLNTESYFHHLGTINERQQVVAIGSTTASHITENGFAKDVFVSENFSEEGLAKAVMKIIQRY
jgi:uroporphyrinogen-III synthase